MSAPCLLVTNMEDVQRSFFAKEKCEMKWAVGPFGELEVWQADEHQDPVSGSMIVFNSLDWSTCEEQLIPTLTKIDCGIVSAKSAL
jgi:hypothetical protein